VRHLVFLVQGKDVNVVNAIRLENLDDESSSKEHVNADKGQPNRREGRDKFIKVLVAIRRRSEQEEQADADHGERHAREERDAQGVLAPHLRVQVVQHPLRLVLVGVGKRFREERE